MAWGNSGAVETLMRSTGRPRRDRGPAYQPLPICWRALKAVAVRG